METAFVSASEAAADPSDFLRFFLSTRFCFRYLMATMIAHTSATIGRDCVFVTISLLKH